MQDDVMDFPEELSHIEQLVHTAEQQRNSHNTTALKRYMDTHPELLHLPLKITQEMTEKILTYMSSGDPTKQAEIRGELDVLRANLERLHDKPNILYALLSEEIRLAYLLLRHSDLVYARHHATLSSLALRRMDTVQIRFLRAIKCLASLHKTVPPIHVNIAQQQVIHT